MRILFVLLCLAGSGVAADCRSTTDALDAMSGAALVLTGPDARTMHLDVLVADDNRERAGGFQHICPAVIDDTAIYFVFPSPRRPSFHMHNVKAPLDIAFIDEAGAIVDIQRMNPYVLGAAQHPSYSPPGKVKAALETRAGYFSRNRISAGSWQVKVQ